MGAAAQFDQPYDVIVLDEDSLLVADFGNHRLRQVDLDGTVSTFAGTGAAGSDGGSLDIATFHSPQGLARDSLGTIYVTDTGSHLVRRIVVDQVTTIAGDGTAGWKDDAESAGRPAVRHRGTRRRRGDRLPVRRRRDAGRGGAVSTGSAG